MPSRASVRSRQTGQPTSISASIGTASAWASRLIVSTLPCFFARLDMGDQVAHDSGALGQNPLG